MLQGLDVSSYQPSVDWPTVARYGRSFAVVKATEGTDYLNPQFVNQLHGAQAAGLAIACYHFFAWGDPTEEAAYFVAKVREQTVLTGVPLAVDFERGGYTVPPDASARFNGVLGAVGDLTGYPPLWYSSTGFLQANRIQVSRANGQWLAAWGAVPPAAVPPASVWAIWQHAAGQSVPGVANAVDSDIFNGSVEQFRAYGGK